MRPDEGGWKGWKGGGWALPAKGLTPVSMFKWPEGQRDPELLQESDNQGHLQNSPPQLQHEKRIFICSNLKHSDCLQI